MGPTLALSPAMPDVEHGLPGSLEAPRYSTLLSTLLPCLRSGSSSSTHA